MGEKVWVTLPGPSGLRIRHVGPIDLGAFYTWLQRWFDFNGYWKDANEKLYSEVIKPDGKKMEIQWQCKKTRTSYLTFVIDLNFLIVNLSDVEVPVQNKKIKMQRADYEFRVAAYIDKKEIPGFIKRIYENLLIRQRIEDYKQELYEDVYKLQAEMKAYLDQYVPSENVII